MVVRRCGCKKPGYVTIKKEKIENVKLTFSDIEDGQEIRLLATKDGLEITCASCFRNLIN